MSGTPDQTGTRSTLPPGSPHPALLLCGPTASGKSDVALELAGRLNAEIVSVDSMQVYRGMDIGTAKPSVEERARVPHHLVDILDPHEAFDAAMFLRLANEAVADIHARGRTAILCGGTGLYFKVFLYGLASSPRADSRVREELRNRELADLLDELKRADPVTFERIDRQNPRRVIRALEVIHVTGRPFSEQRRDWVQARRDLGCVCLALAREAGDLRRRIEARVDAMFARGLVDETRQLIGRGLDRNIVAMQALGYRQVVEHLRGERSLDDTVSLVKIRTWQFARKQMIWFRRQIQPQWIHVQRETSVGDAGDAAAKLFFGHESVQSVWHSLLTPR